MSWKRELDFISGYVIVTVEALDDEERKVKFKFICYVSNNLYAYDKLDYIVDVAHAMAQLRVYYREEIVEVKEASAEASGFLRELLAPEVAE